MIKYAKNVYPGKILLIIFVAFVCNACRSHKPATITATEMLTSCYPIESITISKCKLSISEGDKSYQLAGSIYIRPDSVCYFRGAFVVEVIRGVIYRDSFAVVNRLEKICYKGSNDFLTRMTGYPVNPEMLFLLFTGDRCEKRYKEKLGFRITTRSENRLMMQQGRNRQPLEIHIDADSQTTQSITTAGFKTEYSQYKQYEQFMLPTIFDIAASTNKNKLVMNAVFQEVLFNQPQVINFSVPNNYKVVKLQ